MKTKETSECHTLKKYKRSLKFAIRRFFEISKEKRELEAALEVLARRITKQKVECPPGSWVDWKCLRPEWSCEGCLCKYAKRQGRKNVKRRKRR